MKKMKKIYDSKFFWLVISFLISLSVWVYVTSVETVESSKIFRGIPVQIVGEETILNLHNLVITDVDANTVTVEIRGPRRVVNALDASDLIAQVDVSRLSQPMNTSLNYQIVYPSGTERRNLSIVSRSQDTINFTVSRQTTKSIQVTGGFAGKVAEGYTSLTPVFEPSTITISGPEVYLRDVESARVTFGKDIVADNTYSVETGYTLVDASGNPVSTTEISASPETILATLPILEMREVKLTVGIIEGAGATAENTRITVEPASLMLAGDSSALSGINQIVLDTIDLTKFGSVYTNTYTIPIPNGISNITGDKEARVTVEIVGLETKTIQVNEFNWIGLEDNMEVEVLSQSIPVLLRGPAEILEQILPEDIRVEGNLSEYRNSSGNLIVSVKITVPGYPNVGAISEDGLPEYTVTIRLGRKNP